MNMLEQFQKKFETFNRSNDLIHPSDRVVVAVSGGLDSVVLLYCLLPLQKKWGVRLVVAHFNHKLRGEESNEDERFVASLARKHRLRFVAESGDVQGVARQRKLSIETAAREMRYQFLEKVRQTYRYDKIATGHQADDQAETVLLHLLRGAGWRGLSGIPVKRGNIIRPLLFAFRSELESFAHAAGIQFRTDRSNYCLDFQRNRIRHALLPLMKKDFNPQITRILGHISQLFKEGEEYLQYQANNAYNRCLKAKTDDKIILEIEHFSGYFTIVQKYVLFHLLASMNLDPKVLTFPMVKRILKLIQARKSGRWIRINKDWRIGVDHSGIVLQRRSPQEMISIQLQPGDSVSLADRKIQIRTEMVPMDTIQFLQSRKTEFIDLDRLIRAHLTVRSIQPGDLFVPLGLNHRQKISDYFIDHKIPQNQRQDALVLVDGDDVVWLIGYRLDHRYRITKQTKRALKIQLIDE